MLKSYPGQPHLASGFYSLLAVQLGLLAIILGFYTGSYQLSTLLMIIPTTLVGIFRLSWLGSLSEPRWGLTMLWLYGLYIALIPGMVQITNDQFFWSVQGDYSYPVIIAAVAMMCIGLLITDFTYNIYNKAQEPLQNNLTNEFRLIPNYYTLGLFTLVALVWTIYLVNKFSLTFFMQSRGAVGSVLSEAFSLSELGLNLTLGSALLFALLVIMIDHLTNIKHYRNKLIIFIMTLCVILMNIIINSPTRLSRFSLFAIILASIFVLYRNKILRLKINYFLILLFAPALYFIFRFLGVFTRRDELDFTAAIASVGDLKTTLTYGDFDGLQMHILGLNHVAQEGLHWGQQVLGSLLFFVPRDIWQFKATPSNVLIAESNGQIFTNLSASFYLEGYLDFGWLGVVIVAIILGCLLKWVDKQTNQSIYVLPIFLFIGFLPIIMRGALLAIIAQVVAVIFWSWLICRLSFKKDNI